MNILIPLIDNNSYNSKVSIHFGSCSYFGIYNNNLKTLNIIENKINPKNKNIPPIENILKKDINCIFCIQIGQKAKEILTKKNIKLKTGNYKIISEVIKNINNLNDNINICNH